jgi:hypothetical protein
MSRRSTAERIDEARRGARNRLSGEGVTEQTARSLDRSLGDPGTSNGDVAVTGSRVIAWGDV